MTMTTPFEQGVAMAKRGEPAPDPVRTTYDWHPRLVRMGWEAQFREQNSRVMTRIARRESVASSIASVSRLP